MGNSGWCLSKEVVYQTGEAYRAQNSEFVTNSMLNELDKEEQTDELSRKMENLRVVEVVESPVTDNKAQQVSY